MPRARRVLLAAVGFALLPSRPEFPEVELLRAWLASWCGVGVLERGLASQGLDLQLTRYANRGWRANLYPAGIAHSIVAGSGWAPTPWGALHRAAWQALADSA